MTSLMITLSVVAAQLVVSSVQPEVEGYAGFLVFVFLIGRFLGIYHPKTELEEPLDMKRQVLGWLALLIFVLCFSPRPFITV